MHTPLPWKQLANEIIGPHGDVIATVTGGEGCRFIDDEDNIECSANMRLLLAAPELLAALCEIMSWEENEQMTWAGRARAAIAKAKGKTL